MSGRLCSGCGRLVEAAEVRCPTCGREVAEGSPAPPGWTVGGSAAPPSAPEPPATGSGFEPVPAEVPLPADVPGFEPVPSQAAPPAGVAGFEAVPVQATPQDPARQVHPSSGAVAVGAEAFAPDDERPAAEPAADLPGGPGWRIRAGHAAAATMAEPPPAPTPPAPEPARLPAFVGPLLVILIVATAAAAIALVIHHVLGRQ